MGSLIDVLAEQKTSPDHVYLIKDARLQEKALFFNVRFNLCLFLNK